MGVVEAEGARLQLSEADAAVNAGEVLGEELFIASHVHENDAARHSQGGFDRVGNATHVRAAAGDEAVNHDLDGVPLLLVEVEPSR